MQLKCLVAIAVTSLICGCDSEPSKPDAIVVASPKVTANPQTKPEGIFAPKNVDLSQVEAQRESLTASQNNAVRSAEQYLSMSGFSRKGLIQQLSFDAGDGYSVLDASAAVDSLSVDWNENAAKSARQYLEMLGFSCRSLIQQLSSNAGDKYTVDEATYGAGQAGSC